MGLLEQAAVEAAKKLAENEESHTDTRGIVKASKVFPVVSIASILLALGMAFLKHRQSDAAFYVLAGAFAVLGICLLIYGHNFRIEYDRTGSTTARELRCTTFSESRNSMNCRTCRRSN